MILTFIITLQYNNICSKSKSKRRITAYLFPVYANSSPPIRFVTVALNRFIIDLRHNYKIKDYNLRFKTIITFFSKTLGIAERYRTV